MGTAPFGWIYYGQYYPAAPTVPGTIVGVRTTATAIARPGTISVSISVDGVRALATADARPGSLWADMYIIDGVSALAYAYAPSGWDCHIRFFDPDSSDAELLDPVPSGNGSGNGRLDPVLSGVVGLDPSSSSCR
jgi:hypothetical protein